MYKDRIKFKDIFQVIFITICPHSRSARFFFAHILNSQIGQNPICCLLLSIWLHFTLLLLTTGGCFCALVVFMTSSDKAPTSII